jgi:hypothetical protein
MPLKVEFECNDLRVIGDTIFVRRGPFGSPNSKCGGRLIKYSKKLWTFENTGRTCPETGAPIWAMKAV